MVNPERLVDLLDHLAAGPDPRSPAQTPTALVATRYGAADHLSISMAVTRPALCATLIERLCDETRSRTAAQEQHYWPIAVDLDFARLFAAWQRRSSAVETDAMVKALAELAETASATGIYLDANLSSRRMVSALPVALVGVFSPRDEAAWSRQATIHFHDTIRTDPHEETRREIPPAFHSPQLSGFFDTTPAALDAIAQLTIA